MKCCASPTISTVHNATSGPSSSRAREAASQFNALLLGAAFKPLATALGFYGELVVSSASQAVARAERGGLTDRLERLITENAFVAGSTVNVGSAGANAR
jgi:hypothetical protein